MVDYLEKHIQSTTAAPATKLFDLYRDRFHDIYIFNLHEQGDALTNFVCDALPTANNLCRELKRQQQAEEGGGQQRRQQRLSSSLDGAKLKIEAEKRKIKITNEMMEKFDNFRASNYTEYKKYQSCLSSKFQKRLLDLSLQFEQDVASISKNVQSLVEDSRWQEDHVRNFEAAAAKGKYCEIDAPRLLDDPNSTLMRAVLAS